MFTEQFSQHRFKVQSACVNLEILRTAQKGESMSVIARRLLLEVWVPQRVTSWSSSPSASASPSSPSSLSPLLRSLDSSVGQAMLISLPVPMSYRGYKALQYLTLGVFSMSHLAHSPATIMSLLCLTMPDYCHLRTFAQALLSDFPTYSLSLTFFKSLLKYILFVETHPDRPI